jgi:hypothetical protein
VKERRAPQMPPEVGGGDIHQHVGKVVKAFKPQGLIDNSPHGSPFAS